MPSCRLRSTLGECNNNNIWTVSFSTIKNDGSIAAYCKVYRMCHWSNRFLNEISRSSFMVDIICVIWKHSLPNLYKNLVLLNRLLHGFVILIPSTAVGCFSKQFFVTPQVNQREEEKANITSKLFIPHQGNCWKYRAPMLSSDASCTSLQQIFYDLSTLLGICAPSYSHLFV